MGDRATLDKAKRELEDLYSGIPDDSVNLTFQDLAQVRQHNVEKIKHPLSPTMEINSHKSEKSPRSPSPFSKLPSLDFSKGLEATYPSHHYRYPEEGGMWGRSSHDDHHHSHQHHYSEHGGDQRSLHHSHHHHHLDHYGDQRSIVYDDHHGHHRHHLDHGGEQRSMAYDDMSMAYAPERSGRRRPGIPHSNICAVCCDYIYICRHRCLVCGRVYCRQCVNIGMGEMSEGRKCIQCLGRRFSQRYIHKAGNIGCCMGYRSVVKQQELKWAERGARRSGENRYGSTVMASRSRSPVGLATPTRQHAPSTPPSFVMTPPYSPTNHHPMPF